MLGEDGEHLGRVLRPNLVCVVERKHAVVRGGDERSDPGQNGCPDRVIGSGERVEQPRVDGNDLVDRSSDMPQEHDRLVVAPVERNVGERAIVARGPLRKQRRLAVRAGRDHRD